MSSKLKKWFCLDRFCIFCDSWVLTVSPLLVEYRPTTENYTIDSNFNNTARSHENAMGKDEQMTDSSWILGKIQSYGLTPNVLSFRATYRIFINWTVPKWHFLISCSTICLVFLCCDSTDKYMNRTLKLDRAVCRYICLCIDRNIMHMVGISQFSRIDNLH